jgi:hypothetical protein
MGGKSLDAIVVVLKINSKLSVYNSLTKIQVYIVWEHVSKEESDREICLDINASHIMIRHLKQRSQVE